MSRARHKANGGATKPYNAVGSNVLKEAEEKKRGGRAKRAEGGKVSGDMAETRLDRSPRKRGGRTGSAPFSAANKVKSADGHELGMGDAADGESL